MADGKVTPTTPCPDCGGRFVRFVDDPGRRLEQRCLDCGLERCVFGHGGGPTRHGWVREWKPGVDYYGPLAPDGTPLVPDGPRP